MEILIIISAAIAFGALIAYLWNASRVLEEKNRLLEIAESRLAAISGEVSIETSPSSAGGAEQIAQLESQLHDLTQERSELRAQIESMQKERLSEPETLHDMQTASAELCAHESRSSKMSATAPSKGLVSCKTSMTNFLCFRSAFPVLRKSVPS